MFHGWYIVAAVFVVTTTTSGLAFYNLSILLAAFVSERGFPVALASSATATFFIASGIGGAISGRLIERVDARFVIAVSATVGALALESVSVLRETWQLYAFHIVFGLSHGASGLVPATTLVARWFNARRALAFSIAFTGLSVRGHPDRAGRGVDDRAHGAFGCRALHGARLLPRHRARGGSGLAAEPGGHGPRP